MCLQDKDGGIVPFERHRSRPSEQKNDLACVFGRGYQRRLDERECRGNASATKGMGVA